MNKEIVISTVQAEIKDKKVQSLCKKIQKKCSFKSKNDLTWIVLLLIIIIHILV